MKSLPLIALLCGIALLVPGCGKGKDGQAGPGTGGAGQEGGAGGGGAEQTPPVEDTRPPGSGTDISSPMPASGGPETPPAEITVAHVLIGVKGGGMPDATRTEGEARDLATQILVRARMGEDFTELSKEYSEDPGGGPYTLVNHGRTASPPAHQRSGMVKGFGDVAFHLNVGEVGLALYDKEHSPFGFHVIKRIK